jgi:RNA polymerase sigma factor (sigma-70 family)
MSLLTQDDAELVAASLAGNRDAFGQIVARYQALLCSLAYSATGNLSESEDLAQETFLTAWQRMRDLREPGKLRSWLCGIARNGVNNWLRRQGREPIHAAESLDEIANAPAPQLLPRELTISNEEASILWRSLERIPDNYREPMVLFYREGQSIGRTAALLDLSEDTVKQRLSRGRKLLTEEVASFVESALKQSTPGKAFTLTVLAALPVLSTSAKAATIGAAAALKGGTSAQFATAGGMVAGLIGPLVGFIGPWLQYRIVLDSAKNEEQRVQIRAFFRRMFVVMLGFAGALVALAFFGRALVRTHPGLFVAAVFGVIGCFAFALARYSMCALARYSMWMRGFGKNAASRDVLLPVWEYRSRFEFLGLPLVHIRLGRSTPNWAPVKAWFAVGDCAIGGLFAFGGVAIAPVCIGGLAFGLLPWGGAVIGLMAVGGFALGIWSFGGFAIGWQAFGGCAVAWNAAMGGLAVARDFALGGSAYAAQFNNDVAAQYIKTERFFVIMEVVARYIGWLNLVWMLPLIAWWRAVKRANRNRGTQTA